MQRVGGEGTRRGEVNGTTGRGVVGSEGPMLEGGMDAPASAVCLSLRVNKVCVCEEGQGAWIHRRFG